MKSIQAILAIILVVLMVGMMPDLVDAKKASKTVTLLISPDQLLPTTTEDNYKITPEYASPAESNSSILVYVPLELKGAKQILQISYWYYSSGGGTSVSLRRCKVGEFSYQMANAAGWDDTSGEVIEVIQDDILYPLVEKGYEYFLYITIGNWGGWSYFNGASITYKKK